MNEFDLFEYGKVLPDWIIDNALESTDIEDAIELDNIYNDIVSGKKTLKELYYEKLGEHDFIVIFMDEPNNVTDVLMKVYDKQMSDSEFRKYLIEEIEKANMHEYWYKGK